MADDERRMPVGRYRSQRGGDTGARGQLPTVINRRAAGAVSFPRRRVSPARLPTVAERDPAFEIIAPSTQQPTARISYSKAFSEIIASAVSRSRIIGAGP